MSAEAVTLGGVGQLFLDERGQALRVSWYAEAEIVVLSIWRADQCVGTVRLSPQEARRLAGFLEDVNLTSHTPPARANGGGSSP